MTRLQVIREARGLSRDRLAAMAGVTPGTVFQLENRQRVAKLDTAYAIAAALGLPLEAVFPREDVGPEPFVAATQDIR